MIAILLLLPLQSTAQDVMFWNLENFFDYIDKGTSPSDHEFSSMGERRWTKKRFYEKCSSIAKTILWLGSENGRLPDVIGFEEVENAYVLKQLLSSTALRKLDYKIVHYDSPDTRGIDCALLYRSGTMELLFSKPCRVSTDSLATRDILLAQFRTSGGDSLAVLVNHFPSKYGGAEDWRREIAARRLKEVSDSLRGDGWNLQLAGGDFNDTPDNGLFGQLEPALFLCRKVGKEPGSIRFNGQWELIDLCFASPELLPRVEFRVCPPPFLTTRDAAHSGEKPLRTYSGPRYLGGVSDHYPIAIRLK